MLDGLPEPLVHICKVGVRGEGTPIVVGPRQNAPGCARGRADLGTLPSPLPLSASLGLGVHVGPTEQGVNTTGPQKGCSMRLLTQGRPHLRRAGRAQGLDATPARPSTPARPHPAVYTAPVAAGRRAPAEGATTPSRRAQTAKALAPGATSSAPSPSSAEPVWGWSWAEGPCRERGDLAGRSLLSSPGGPE